MLIIIDEKNFNVNIRLGAMETYSPNEEIEQIVTKAKAIKELKDNFLDNIFNPEVKKLLDLVDRVNKMNNPELNSKNKQP